MDSDKKRIGSHLRKKRWALTEKEQAAAAASIARNARQLGPLFKGERILSYSSFAGEVDPGKLVASLKGEIYLPKICNFRTRHMRFFRADKHLRTNWLGISEPSESRPSLLARQFDAVLLPLLAFDRSGNRVGMGAGFYDRAFAFRQPRTALRKPLLIGLAHHFQELNSINADSWDVPLDVIITDQELIIPKQPKTRT